MNGLIKFSMKNVAAVIIIVAMLFGGGMFSATKLKQENYPNISFPAVFISTTYPGSPKDVMDNVTKPIEDKLANIPDLDQLTSTSNDNYSFIQVMFKHGVDLDKKKREVENLIQDVSLPSTAQRPKAMTFGFSSMPAYYLVVSANEGVSQTELDKLYKDKIKPGFEGIKGIDHITAIGNRETTMDIQLNADALSAFGLTPSQVTASIESALSKGPIGSVELSGNEKMARVFGDLESLYAVEQLELTVSSGGTVLLSQVAKVSAVTESKFMARLDGKAALGIHLFKTSDANAVEFSDAADKLMNDWKTTMPNVTFRSIFNTADEVKESISGMLREGVMGAILASLMILIFLRNVRMTLVVLVSIPLSMLITLLLLHYLNITLNMMTLGGMFIAVGRVVDDSIVVIENIYTSLEKAQERNESVILMATKQVAMAITSSTIATVAVFAPIGMVSGMVGEFFRPFAITIAVALMASLLVALTVIPMLAKLLVLRGKFKAHDETKVGRFTSMYESALEWSLTHRIKSLLISGLLFILSIVIVVPNLAIALFPDGAQPRNIYYTVKLPYETSYAATDLKSKELEKMLMESKDSNGDPVLRYVEALVGYNGGDGVNNDRVPYAFQLFVEMNENVKPDQVRDQFKNAILAELPKGSEVLPSSLGGGGPATTDFGYTLYGNNQKDLIAAAGIVKKKLAEFPELYEVKDALSDAKTVVDIVVDQKKARTYGLDVSTIRETARGWVQKQQLGDVKLDDVTYKTTVSLSKKDKDTLEKLGRLPISTKTGTVYLNEVAKIREVEAPASISRKTQKQEVSITAKINGANKNGVSLQVNEALKTLELPEGVTRELGGVNKDTDENFGQLYMAMSVAVFIVYLVMVLAFGNASAPFAILFSLPLAAIGGLLALLITRESLNITSMIGFLMLIGIVVTNAIVLLERVQQLREEGYTVRHALMEAGKVRLRPIIMTAAATIMALLPLALGFAHGTLISKGLAVVVIGGLTTSTILTLVVVPIVYEMIESWKSRISGWFNRKKPDDGSKPATIEM
ncbi:efflux RND transporter permease subunit [Paenibacillus oleatilyticus]|uniref:efflux RND transporter permease subunit n=1 Tax=Paenibacillus oleatilyticus TaxID=2594886 RepID=UPI001C1F5551|nr:efflux RND transporter permease subunit [Paenibacillus oleatilyticus]MBU7316653.1 efflux RND transporter permease subunit [Paenibacillus oleatilyticus]